MQFKSNRRWPGGQTAAKKEPGKLKELQDALDEWEKKNTVAPLWPSAADVLIEVNGKWYRFPS